MVLLGGCFVLQICFDVKKKGDSWFLSGDLLKRAIGLGFTTGAIGSVTRSDGGGRTFRAGLGRGGDQLVFEG